MRWKTRERNSTGWPASRHRSKIATDPDDEDDIYHLADYGFAPAEIARRVGSPIGEVELVLSLRQS